MTTIFGYYKRSVLRRQCSDTNRNLKSLMYCRYGNQDLTFRAYRRYDFLLKWPTLETLDFAFHISSTPTFLHFYFGTFFMYRTHNGHNIRLYFSPSSHTYFDCMNQTKVVFEKFSKNVKVCIHLTFNIKQKKGLSSKLSATLF